MSQDQSTLFTEPARLVFEEVTVGYGQTPVLKEISLEIPQGLHVAVVGPNGAGKTTLFKTMVNLLPVWSGKILIHGRPFGQHQDCIAYIPQRGEVDWRFPVTVEDVVMMGRFARTGMFRRPNARDHEVVQDCMNRLGILPIAGSRIIELSGGQQQRIFLARALAQKPHILLMDEPFTGIDFTTQETILEIVDSLRDAGVTVMVATHDLNLASEQFDRVILLNHELVAYGNPGKVMTRENIRKAFGSHVMFMDGVAVVDHCCPPGNEMDEL
jgi:manganese/iron transport system ATP-binding protein